MQRIWPWFGALGGLGMLAAVAISGFGLAAEARAATDAQIKIANFTFDPPTLTIKAGTTVTWVNTDDIPHLVSAKDGSFRSSALDTDDAYTQTFKKPGTVEYFCVLHPRMTGKVVVEP